MEATGVEPTISCMPSRFYLDQTVLYASQLILVREPACGGDGLQAFGCKLVPACSSLFQLVPACSSLLRWRCRLLFHLQTHGCSACLVVRHALHSGTRLRCACRRVFVWFSRQKRRAFDPLLHDFWITLAVLGPWRKHNKMQHGQQIIEPPKCVRNTELARENALDAEPRSAHTPSYSVGPLSTRCRNVSR